VTREQYETNREAIAIQGSKTDSRWKDEDHDFKKSKLRIGGAKEG